MTDIFQPEDEAKADVDESRRKRERGKHGMVI